jgi:hypothetical protein
MKKEYLYYAAVVALGLFAGIYARGYSDAKGWTTATA